MEEYKKRYGYMKEKLDEVIIELDEQKEQLIAVYLKHFNENRNFKKGDRRTVPLLIGPSGSGKTALVQALSNITDRPFYCIDASNTAASGYKGQDLSEKLGVFFQSLNRNEKKFNNSIIFIDEFDKLVTNTYLHQSGAITDQQQFLSFLDSDSFTVSCDKTPVKLDTSNVFIILAGAFGGLYKAKKKENISFGFVKESKDKEEKEDTNEMIGRLEKFGIIPEIIGRISVLIPFPEPNKNTILKIMSSDTGVIDNWKNFFDINYYVGLNVHSDAKEYIANSVISLPLGVRAINHYINPLMNKVLIDVENDLTIQEVHVRFDIAKGLYTEYERGEERKIVVKETTLSKIKRHVGIRGIKKIWFMYEDSREQIEFLVELYTDKFSKRNKNISFKFLKKVESFYRSALMYLSCQVGFEEITEDSLLKLLDIGTKLNRNTRTTFFYMIEKDCTEDCEYKKEIQSNYESYLMMPHYLCTDEMKDSILLSVMETQIGEENDR